MKCLREDKQMSKVSLRVDFEELKEAMKTLPYNDIIEVCGLILRRRQRRPLKRSRGLS